jgi:hypothetical protein
MRRIKIKHPSHGLFRQRKNLMTQDNFDGAMERLLYRQPFKPFVVVLHDGSRFEIDYPSATLYRPGIGKSIFMSPGGVPIYYDHDSVVQIIDAPATAAPGRKEQSGVQ